MVKDINFKGYDHAYADTISKDGEVYVPYNLTDYGNGAYANAYDAAVRVTLPDTCQAVAIHKTGVGNNLILADTSGNLYFTSYTETRPVITMSDLEYIGHTGDILDIKQSGNVLAIAGTDRMMYVVQKGVTYRLLKEAPQMPVIEFGLQRAGSLACSDKISISSAEAAAAIGTTLTGSAASRVHPSASGAKTEAADISSSLISMYTSSVRSQCTAKGYVDRPFMVRYALRLYDGTYMMASPPVLMLPTVLPPRISVAVGGSGQSATITADLSANSYYQLRQRVLSDASPEWTDIIAAVDIFVSEPVSTYDTDDTESGHITDYRTVTEGMDSGGFVRGRPGTGIPGRGVPTVFDGHYSTGGDCYTDHYLDTAQLLNVWHLTPNHRLQDQLMCIDTFYRIASIPYSELTREESFTPVSLLTSDFSDLTEHQRLGAESICALDIIPSAITDYCDRLVISSDIKRMQRPVPLRAMATYSGSASETGTDVTITVYSHHMGKTYKSSCTSEGMAASLAESFPRYIYYPDPRAYMMSFTQGGITRHISLTPHETLPGGYWWGGLADGYTPEAADDIPAGEPTQRIYGDTRIYTSVDGNPLCLSPEPIHLGHTAVMAMHMALQAPKLGSFGQYPIYAFTTDGIFMLQHSESTQSISSAKMISDVVAHGRHAIVPAGGTVAFMSDGMLMSVEGSHVKCLSKAITGMLFDIRRLPHHRELPDIVSAQPTADDIDDMLDEAILTYSHKHQTIVIGGRHKDYSLAYSLASGTLSICDIAISSLVYCGIQGIWNDGRHRIVGLDECRAARPGLLITRPIKTGTAPDGIRVMSAEVIGDFAAGHVKTVLYGADRIREWHMVESSQTGAIIDINRLTYKYICILLITRLEPGEYITGLEIGN